MTRNVSWIGVTRWKRLVLLQMMACVAPAQVTDLPTASAFVSYRGDNDEFLLTSGCATIRYPWPRDWESSCPRYNPAGGPFTAELSATNFPFGTFGNVETDVPSIRLSAGENEFLPPGTTGLVRRSVVPHGWFRDRLVVEVGGGPPSFADPPRGPFFQDFQPCPAGGQAFCFLKIRFRITGRVEWFPTRIVNGPVAISFALMKPDFSGIAGFPRLIIPFYGEVLDEFDVSVAFREGEKFYLTPSLGMAVYRYEATAEGSISSVSANILMSMASLAVVDGNDVPAPRGWRATGDSGYIYSASGAFPSRQPARE